MWNPFKVAQDRKRSKEYWKKHPELEANIRSFNVMPTLIDGSFENWLLRLALYGHKTFYYRNTAEDIDRPSSFTELITIMDAAEKDGTLKDWYSPERTAYNTVSLLKEVEYEDGTVSEEEFIVIVEPMDANRKLLMEVSYQMGEISNNQEQG